jgi:hypothetical protein
MPRQQISSSVLYAILDREFRKRRPAECRSCMTPLPYFQEPRDEVSANWMIGTPAECPHRCQAVLAEIVANLWTKYDLRPDA